MPGRRPKPTAIKVLEGNPGKRKLNAAEPTPPPAITRVPRGKLPPDGRRLWRALAEHLAALGVLKVTDLAALEMLCLHYSVARDAFEEIQGKGLTTESVLAGVKKNPAVSIFRENSAAFKSYLVEFGLTPSSRVKIHAEPVEKEKTLAEMLFEGTKE